MKLSLYSGVPKYQRRPRHRIETHVQLRTSFSSVKRELSSMVGGGGFYDQNGPIRLYFKTSSQNRHIYV